MIDSLEIQLSLLEHHYEQAFKHGKIEFLPEIATKLRLLLWQAPRQNGNEPLLFKVMHQFGLNTHLTLDGPPVDPPPIEITGVGPPQFGPMTGETISLYRFFNLKEEFVSTSRGGVWKTKLELIRGVSEQLGGAHSDWEIDEDLFRTLSMGPWISGMPAYAPSIEISARIVIRHGRLILAEVRRQQSSANDADNGSVGPPASSG